MLEVEDMGNEVIIGNLKDNIQFKSAGKNI